MSRIRWKRVSVGRERRLTAGGLEHDAPALLPGSRQVVHRVRTEGNSGLVLTDRRGRFARPLVLDPGAHGPPRPGPDGRLVFYGYQDPEEESWQVRTVEPATNQAGVLLESSSVQLLDPLPMPDGERLVFSSDEGSPGILRLWELTPAENNRRPITTAPERSDDQPSVSPSGRFLAFRGRREGHADLYLLDLDTLETRQLTAAEGESGEPCFVDDYRLVFSRRTPGGGRGLLLLDTLECRETWITGALAGASHPFTRRTRKGRIRLYYSRLEGADRGGATRRDVYRATLVGVRLEPPA